LLLCCLRALAERASPVAVDFLAHGLSATPLFLHIESPAERDPGPGRAAHRCRRGALCRRLRPGIRREDERAGTRDRRAIPDGPTPAIRRARSHRAWRFPRLAACPRTGRVRDDAVPLRTPGRLGGDPLSREVRRGLPGVPAPNGHVPAPPAP